MCEAPHNDPDVSLGKLVVMFQSADPQVLMDEDEYRDFQGLGDCITAAESDSVASLKQTLCYAFRI